MSTKTRVYACGGLGTNLGQFAGHHTVERCFIDTSQSNLTDAHDKSACYFIDGVDGSGKNRRENHQKIAEETPDILERFPAADFNIVLFSAAGGSGSVIGPLILKELLKEGEAVVAVVVGADDTSISVRNTTDTLKSLEAISAMTGQPTIMAYRENTPGVRRGDIDGEVVFIMDALSALASQGNQEMDTQDLVNMVQYQKVSPVTPQLTALEVFETRQEAARQVEPLAVASLYASPDDNNPFGNPYYSTVGYPREPISFAEQLHFVINLPTIEEIYSHLTDRQTELNKAYSGYGQRRTRVDVDDNVTSDGLVI